MYGVLSIPNTAALLAECWIEAERALRHQVQKYSPGLDEEGITLSFHTKLAESLYSASDTKKIERAFARDFELSFPNDFDLQVEPEQIARGLRASVTLHRRATETLTGGDFGLVIQRPHIQLRHSSLRVTHYGRGLLTQAKLKSRQGWPSFTKNQQKVLPERLDYLALLLYRYSDIAMRELNPFTWQIANGLSFESLKTFLKEDSFPNRLISADIIKQLSTAKIGTDNRELINDLVSPDSNRSLVIEINWPPGEHPGSEIHVHSRHQVRNVQRILVQR